jgi:hypothetical protein
MTWKLRKVLPRLLFAISLELVRSETFSRPRGHQVICAEQGQISAERTAKVPEPAYNVAWRKEHIGCLVLRSLIYIKLDSWIEHKQVSKIQSSVIFCWRDLEKFRKTRYWAIY